MQVSIELDFNTQNLVLVNNLISEFFYDKYKNELKLTRLEINIEYN